MGRTAALIILLSISFAPEAQIKLPAIFRDSMILQRDMPVRIWGWAMPKEKVRVSFKNKTFNLKADDNGRWTMVFTPTPAGGPYTIGIEGRKSGKTAIREILFGDVWFCSGQSNMVHQLNIHDVTYAREIAEANYPQIRQFWIPTNGHLIGPQNDLPAGYWKPAVGDDVRPFSAVAYFFALKIHQRYNVPVGIINASIGGTPVDAWISEEGLNEFPTILSKIDDNRRKVLAGEYNPPVNTTPRPVVFNLEEESPWLNNSFNPVGWKTIHVPGYWEDQGLRDLDGVVWYRKDFVVNRSMLGNAGRLHLGRIVDADAVYINGKKIGETGYQYPQRRYPVPVGILKEGVNTIFVAITNHGGKGGFVPDKNSVLVVGNDSIDLKGTWLYRVKTAFGPNNQSFQPPKEYQPAAAFNGMVAPVIPYTIKGFCWYQGESDTWRAAEYATLQRALIRDWRKKWNNPIIPFLYVQLPGFMDYHYQPMESDWALLREAQAAALAVPRTAMAVAIDLGEWNDIHPENKKDVGERLALAALSSVYKDSIVGMGPIWDTAIHYTDRIEVSFKHAASGLSTSDGNPPAEFAIAGEDKKFIWAKTKIEGNKVIVWHPDLPNPRYVRYAWADNPFNPNLINMEGLPASPFRTDK